MITPIIFLAMSGSDYIFLLSPFEVNSTDLTRKCVNITINDDHIIEGNQTFIVILENLRQRHLVGHAAEITILIIDNG